jgi:phosphopantothenoylcysteine decarboxylase / phosphopantothenate---cysteine ligase
MGSLLPKPRILLGVTGSVAAYKALELVRSLQVFAEVRVVLTESGARLVPERELRRASGHPVWRSLFKGSKPIPPGTPSGSHPLTFVPHIEYAKRADLVLIAPASADILAKLAQGLADDLLSTLCLYAPCPIWVAPAMNTRMWSHPSVVVNRKTLLSRGVRFLGPDSGHLACGDVGDGRFVEPSEIALQVGSHFRNRSRWKGKKVLLTAGPTREPLDPVRFLTNRSSGKMGYALAQAALNRGAEVTLVTGPVTLSPPSGAKAVPVETAQQMRDQVARRLKGADLVVLAAAVADFTPSVPSRSKIKKGKGGLGLRLRKTPDILGEVLSSRDPWQVVMAFAAETERLRENALKKWRRKPSDILAANLVGREGSGFDSDRNEFLVFLKGHKGTVKLPRASKSALAERLMDLAERAFQERGKR